MKQHVFIAFLTLFNSLCAFSQHLENPFIKENGLGHMLLTTEVDKPAQVQGSIRNYPPVMHPSSDVSLAIPQLRNRTKEQELGIGIAQFGLNVLSKGRWNQVNTQHLYYPNHVRIAD